jgi:UDP:flavonoid glycosyltransferase YjiC (YdhE family)
MISQGGTNTGTYMLLHGVPIFILPLELEQMLWAYRLSQQGLAATVNYFSQQPNIESKLRNILESDTLTQQAKKFSQRYAHYNQNETIEHIVEKCSKLVQV